MDIGGLNLLKSQGIKFDTGLTSDEVVQIEAIYEFTFPQSIREFLMLALPVSKGFYNWRNTTGENIEFIKQVMESPATTIEDMAEEIDWCDIWGNEPEDKNYAIKTRLKSAPRLLPIYIHRYMPIVPDKNPPILSIHGIDIIYYGKNLKDYFEVEFGEKKQSEIEFSDIRPIPFWSDFM